MSYVDGFVVPVPRDRVAEYEKIARDAAAVWLEHGALSVTECVADDVSKGEVTSFPRAVQASDDETVVFSWIAWPSRTVRDQGMKKVMEDPRMKTDPSSMPFDGKRMIYGGFEAILEV